MKELNESMSMYVSEAKQIADVQAGAIDEEMSEKRFHESNRRLEITLIFLVVLAFIALIVVNLLILRIYLSDKQELSAVKQSGTSQLTERPKKDERRDNVDDVENKPIIEGECAECLARLSERGDDAFRIPDNDNQPKEEFIAYTHMRGQSQQLHLHIPLTVFDDIFDTSQPDGLHRAS
ncbi:unnamed protein product [Toxocara canis]|nr:unnamed protein product [Toxocara canis]